MKAGLLLTVICILSALNSIYAQTRTISGTVRDKEGEGIPGVTIVVKESPQTGTISSIDGTYTLNIPENAEALIFSFIGMKKVEAKIGQEPEINVVLEDETENLDEVMVVAYGKATKMSFTGSAKSVSGDKLESKNTSEISKALVGEVAGVQVINGSGQPGTSATIRIRGLGSVNASRSPLYVVDGVPYGGDLSSIAPSDIESTTILKDATATALFGSRGANGVILITTKKGKKGESDIEVDLKYGVNMRLLPLYDKIESPERYTELTWEGLYNRYKLDPSMAGGSEMDYRQMASQDLFSDWGISPYYNLWNVEDDVVVDPVSGRINANALRRFTPGDWSEDMFRNGIKNEATVKISGGADRLSYFTSYGFLKDEGYYTGSDFKRFNSRANISHQAKEWLRGDVGLSYSYTEMNSPGQGGSANNGFYFAQNIPPIYPVYERDEEGNKIKDELIGGYKYDYGFGTDRARGFSANINPAGAAQLDINENISHQVTANSLLEAMFLKNFKLSTNIGIQAFMNLHSGMDNMFYGDSEGLGRISKTNSLDFSYTWNQMLSYYKTVNNSTYEAFVAHESSLAQSKSLSGSMSKIVMPFSTELSNAIIKDGMSSGTGEIAMESYFGQAKYNYKNKYHIHGTVRRDGTSRFPNNRWGTFGSIGLSWVMSNENLLKNISWLKNLKTKISYGVLGNQSLGTYYPTFDSYSINNLNDEIAINFGGKGNPNLTWERSESFNAGLEANIGNRLELEVEYFEKTVNDLLYYKQVAPSLGYASYPVNDGEIMNKGIEFTVLGHIINKKDYGFNVSVNGASYENIVTKMPLDDVTGEEKPIEFKGGYAFSKGRSLYDFYLREWAGVDPETGAAQWYRYYDEQPDGEKVYISDMVNYSHSNKINKLGKEKTDYYPDATKKYNDKSAIPIIAGGFSFNIFYKGLQLDMQFAYSYGGYSYDNVYAMLMSDHAPGSNNWSPDILKRWRNEGDITDVPRLSANYDKYDAGASTRFITTNSFLNLSNTRLTYNFSKNTIKSMNLSGLSLWFTADNLFIMSARKGFTPSTSESGNSGSHSYAPLSSFTTGLKVRF